MKNALYLTIFIIVAFISAVGLAFERATNDNEIYSAACRIYCDNSLAGSGTIISNDEDGAFILTNYHVAGQASKITCHFFGDGHIKQVSAQRVWRAYNEQKALDACILYIEADKIRAITPYYIPIASIGVLKTGDTIVTAGAPSATWLKLMHGSIDSTGDGTFKFRPTPYGGQSGSSIIEYKEDGLPYIVGLLTWRTDTEGSDSPGGMAQPISRIIDALKGEVNTSRVVLPENAVEVPEFINYNGVLK